MKKVFFLTILSFSTTVSFAQSRQTSFGVYGGVSLPISSYADSDISSGSSGLAANGFNISANLVHEFTEIFGFSMLLSYNSNSFKVAEMEKQFLDSYGYEQFKVRSTNYQLTAFLPGVQFSIPMGKFETDFRAHCGFSILKPPTLKTSIVDGRDHVEIKQVSSRSLGLSEDVGAGLRYHLSDRIQLNMFLEYLIALHKFDVEISSNVDPDRSGTDRQVVSTLNCTFGIAYVW